jgi:hypothetical protein
MNVFIGELWLMKEILSFDAKWNMIAQKESSKMI